MTVGNQTLGCTLLVALGLVVGEVPDLHGASVGLI